MDFGDKPFGKVVKGLDWEPKLARMNKIMAAGKECQFVESNQNEKMRVTCLTSEAVKVEHFNYFGEDPGCYTPYPKISDIPSYTAKSNEDCIWQPNGHPDGYYIKLTISSTSASGQFEKTGESWEIEDFSQPKKKGDEYTYHWQMDHGVMAETCQIVDVEYYLDEQCLEDDPMGQEEKFSQIDRFNQILRSRDCNYTNPKDKGEKLRVYCEDPQSASFAKYNLLNEDPYCLRSYFEASMFPTFYARDGECIKIGPKIYAKFTIKPDGLDYSINRYSRDSTADKDSEKNMTSKEMSESSGSNGFSFEGDGYSMSIKME